MTAPVTSEAVAPVAESTPDPVLGRLTEYGIQHPWQAVLLLPSGYEDYSIHQSGSQDLEEGRRVTLTGDVVAPLSTVFGNNRRVPRSSTRLMLDDGVQIHLTWFGDTRPFAKKLTQGTRVSVSGQLKLFSGQWSIASPVLVESGWLGRCRPVYPAIGKRMAQDTLRQRILHLVKAHLQDAAAEILKRLPATEPEVLKAIGAAEDIDNLERLLVRAHYPVNEAVGTAALAALDRIAAWIALDGLIGERVTPHRRDALPLDTASQIAKLPVTLTAAQLEAIEQMRNVFSRDAVGSMLLTGDVGSGKTFCYLTIAAAAADCGGRIAVLLPSSPLAAQVAGDARTYFPGINVALVVQDSEEDAEAAQIVVGTTALLNRRVGRFDLLICDEQHKLGASQRRQLCSPGTHFLDVTATAIPRTLALARYGMIESFHIEQGHARKKIRTRLWTGNKSGLFAELRKDVEAGDRALVVYPAIEANNKAAPGKQLRSIEDAQDKWMKIFPDRVRVLIGKMTDEEKTAALSDLVEGRASIGICTSVVEVGINIPRLRRVVVVHPERFGLTALHQMRGRIAREGGTGSFDMLLTDEPSDAVRKRLDVLVRCNDGKAIAEEDLRLRGPGEIHAAGEKQSGSALSILYGRELSIDAMEAMAQIAEASHQPLTHSNPSSPNEREEPIHG